MSDIDELGALESRVRAALHREPLPVAPDTLRDALDAITTAAPAVRTAPRRGWWGALGVAAALAVGGAIALLGGGGHLTPPPSQPIVSPAPATRITYAIAWSADVPSSDAVRSQLVGALQSRAASVDPGIAVAALDADHVAADVPAAVDLDRVRRLLGPIGRTTLVALGQRQMEAGQRIDPGLAPLTPDDPIETASAGTDETGLRVLDLKLTPAAGAVFATWTADHVGDYLAIAVDGIVVSAPRINSAIPGGDVEISQPGGWAADDLAATVAILGANRLPVAIREVDVTPVDHPLPVPSVTAAAATIVPAATASPAYSVTCEPPAEVEGELSCADGVRRVLDALPPDAPIASVSFVHNCQDVFIGASDCFVPAFGQVTVTFLDGTSATVEVSSGSPGARLLTPANATSDPPLVAIPIDTNLTCSTDETIAPYVFHVDRTSGAVTATSPAGTTVSVRFGARYSRIVGPMGLIVAYEARIGSPTIVIADGRPSIVGDRSVAVGLRSCLAADGSVIAISLPFTR